MSDEHKPPTSLTSGFANAFGLAAEMVATTLVGAGLGWLLGNWLGLIAVFVPVGVILGGIAGVTLVYRRLGKV